MSIAKKSSGGGLCLYVNYHTLNVHIMTDAWLLLHIDDLLSQLKDSRVFSSLDLRDSYH